MTPRPAQPRAAPPAAAPAADPPCQAGSQSSLAHLGPTHHGENSPNSFQHHCFSTWPKCV